MVVNVPKVIIVKPNNTSEQEQELIRNVEHVMEKIIKEECGITVKIKLIKNDTSTKQLAKEG